MCPITTMGMTVKRKICVPTGNETSAIVQPIALSYLTDELPVKGKDHPTTCHERPKEEQRYSSTLSLTSALDWGVGSQRHATAALLPGKTRYPLVRRLGGPQGQSGQMRKISPPTGIRPPDRPARSESL
jgi:hypothetical protein